MSTLVYTYSKNITIYGLSTHLSLTYPHFFKVSQIFAFIMTTFSVQCGKIGAYDSLDKINIIANISHNINFSIECCFSGDVFDELSDPVG